MRRQLAALVLALCLPSPGLAAQVVVKPGQTLSEIAARAGISTERLMQLNGIRDANKIVAGQKLTVPGGTQRGGGGNRGNGPTATAQGGRVTIRQGETLSEISARYGVSVERLMQLNRISDPSKVVAGDSLILRAPAPSRNGGGGAGRNGGGTTVTVQPGDTLSEIADRHNISIERLMQLNRIQNPSQVIAGEKLIISTRPPARTTRPGSTGQTAGTQVHVVQPGETLSEIASDYKVPVQRLASLNNLKDPDELITGTRLRLTAPPPVPRTAPRTTTRPRSTTRPRPPATTSPTVAQSTPPRRPQTTTPATAANGAGTTPAIASRTPATTTSRSSQGPAPTTSTAPATQAASAGGTSTPAATSRSVATTRTTTTPITASSADAAAVASTRTPTTNATSTATSTGTSTVAPAAAATTTTAATAATTSPTTTSPASTTPARTTTPTTTVATASRRQTTTGTTTTSATRTRPVVADWRTYGPMQVDWASWQSMGGSYVAPVLTSAGQPFYLAINCGARKLNTTGASGQWKTWDAPQTEFEQSLVNDLCRLKGG